MRGGGVSGDQRRLHRAEHEMSLGGNGRLGEQTNDILAHRVFWGGERASQRTNGVLARRLGIRKEEARKLRVLYSRVRRRRRSSRYVSRRCAGCHLLPHWIRLPAARKRPKRVPLPRVVRPMCLTLSMPGIYGGDGAGGRRSDGGSACIGPRASRGIGGLGMNRARENIDAAPCTRTTRTSHTPRPPRPRRWRPAQPP